MTTTIILITILIFLLLIYGVYKFYQRLMINKRRIQMGRAFTNISHELLTPLTVISASVEKLRDEEPRYNADYALMDLNINRMVRLLQEILETSKSQAGELKLKVSQGDVMEYVSQTALCLKPLMEKRQLNFDIHCWPNSMMGWIDTDKLDKIIYNVLSNAAKYTEPGGSVSITAETNKTYDHVVITVKDTGIGMSKIQLKHLFQRFYDGDYRRMKVSGTGLGLPLVRDLVDLHGGSIKCKSERGNGTTFFIELPINKEAFAKSQIDEEHKIDLSKPSNSIADLSELLPQPESSEAQQFSIMNTDDGSSHILLVEDNAELLMLMQTLLSQHYRVFTAKNGTEALKVLESEDIDVVVSDVMMPEMDGNELTRRIKDNPDTSHLPVILLTAKTQEEDRKKSLIIGADDHIAKPFRIGDLQLRIDNIIENRKRIRREYKEQSIEDARAKTNNAQPTADEKFLQRAIDCVYSHLSDADFDRDAFAAEMGASASTLYNKLRALTGLNVSAFIRDIRMKEAKRLVQTDMDLRVSDLAYKVGFRDPKYFSTCFKKEFGLQPSEFMEKVKSEE